MSDDYLRLIPVEPEYSPSSERIDQAVDILSRAINARPSRVVAETNIRFVDPGSNLESITCPGCSAELDFGWWGEAMNQAAESSFTDLVVEVPCCGRYINLNELHYVEPAGFARFMVEYRNPQHDVSDATLRMASELLGVQLRRVWAHY